MSHVVIVGLFHLVGVTQLPCAATQLGENQEAAAEVDPADTQLPVDIDLIEDINTWFLGVRGAMNAAYNPG